MNMYNGIYKKHPPPPAVARRTEEKVVRHEVTWARTKYRHQNHCTCFAVDLNAKRLEARWTDAPLLNLQASDESRFKSNLAWLPPRLGSITAPIIALTNEAFRKNQTMRHLYKANATVWIGSISKTMDPEHKESQKNDSIPNGHMWCKCD